VRETLSRPTDLPNTQRRKPRPLPRLTAIEGSVGSGRAVSLPEDLVREDSVQNLPLELAFLVLIERAHAHVPIRCPATAASQPLPVRLSSRAVLQDS